MTEPIADQVLDEVMVLGIELAAVAKPKDPKNFVALLQRFAHAIIREAFEHQDDVRALLNIPRVNAAPRSPEDDWRLCPYCQTQHLATVDHHCERMRELGLGDETKPFSSSTGAAAAEPNADIPTGNRNNAASETPAAPSTSCPGCFVREGYEHLPGCRLLAEPAPSSSETADGAGTSPAGPRAGAEASQLKNRRRMTPAQIATLRAVYERDVGEDGELPYGWLSKQAKALGFTMQSIQSRTDAWRDERARPSTREAVTAKSNGHQAAREHTNGHSCWCRKGPNKGENRWCTNAPAPRVLPGLRSRVPPTARNERLGGERPRRDSFEGEA